MTKLIKLVIGTIATVLILGGAVGVFGWATDWGNDWSFGNLRNVGKKITGAVYDGNGNVLEEGKVYDLPENLNFATTPDENGNVTLRATVLPENAYNKALTWAVSWENSASAWASGKNVNDYITLTVDSSNDSIATLACKNAFGERGRVTVTANDNPEAKAVCNIDYVKRTTKTMVKYVPYLNGTPYESPAAETEIPAIDFTKNELQIQKFITADSDFDGVRDLPGQEDGTNRDFFLYSLIPSDANIANSSYYKMMPEYTYDSDTPFTKEDVLTTTAKMYFAGTSEQIINSETIDSFFEYCMRNQKLQGDGIVKMQKYLAPHAYNINGTELATGAKGFDVTNGYNFNDRFFIENLSFLYKGFDMFSGSFEQKESLWQGARDAFLEVGQSKAFPIFTIEVTTTGKYCPVPVVDQYHMGMELFKTYVMPESVTVSPSGGVEF